MSIYLYKFKTLKSCLYIASSSHHNLSFKARRLKLSIQPLHMRALVIILINPDSEAVSWFVLFWVPKNLGTKRFLRFGHKSKPAQIRPPRLPEAGNWKIAILPMLKVERLYNEWVETIEATEAANSNRTVKPRFRVTSEVTWGQKSKKCYFANFDGWTQGVWVEVERQG